MNAHALQQKKLGLLALALLLLIAAGLFFNNKINKLLISGFHPHVNQNQIVQQLIHYKEKNWWLVNKELVSQAIEQLPWIQSVKVSMLWPDTIQLNIQEHTPVFRWNNQQLIARSGTSFQISDAEYTKWSALPILEGTPKNQPEFIQIWLHVDQMLKKLGLQPKRLHITPWNDWHIHLKNGSIILLTKKNILKKINMLAAFLKEEYNFKKNDAFRIDLRGQGGVAIRPL